MQLTYDTQPTDARAPSSHLVSPKLALCKQADALLRDAGCDTMSGARKDRAYHRNKCAESRRMRRHYRARCKRLGKFGKASSVRFIPVFCEEEMMKESQGRSC
jgi:hypothetical protein